MQKLKQLGVASILAAFFLCSAMNTQKALGLSFDRLPGESAWLHKARVSDLVSKNRRVTPEKLLADLLKRQAKRAMVDVTECPPDTLPAHLARLDALRETINHCLTHWLAGTAENRLSGAQLANPFTLRDYLGCIEITREQHRCPAFVNSRDSDLAAINRKLDTLAGLLATSPAIENLLTDESEAA